MNYNAWSDWKQEDILANGLKIWYKHIPAQTAVLCAIIDAGSRHDGEYPGIAHFTEHMLFQGTKKMQGEEIKLVAAKNGIRINASTAKEFMTVDLEAILPDKIETAMDICYEVVTSPIFPKDAFEKERRVVLNEIRDKEDRPLSKAMELANAIICKPPFVIPVLGTVEVIEDLKVESMIEFHASRFMPKHITVCYAGPMSMQALVALCNVKFGKWRPTHKAQWDSNKFVTHKTQAVLHKPMQSQVAAVIAYPGTRIESEDKLALKLLCDIIGGGAMISRMFRQLRNEQGLCYFCGAFSQEFYSADGLLALCGNINPARTPEFINGALKIIEDINDKAPITQEELDTSKTRFKAEMLETIDNLSSYMQWFLYLWMAHGSRDIGTDLKKIDALTLKDLKAVFDKYFSMHPAIVLVGNIPELAQKQLNEITTFELEAVQAPANYGGGNAMVDRPSPAGSHATTPNSVAPSYSGSDRKVENMDDVLQPEEDDDDDLKGETMQDAEPSCIPKSKSACKVCGQEFEHLAGVTVYKCPDCKLHDIDSNQPPKKVSIYSQDHDSSVELQGNKPAGQTSPGRDVVTNPIAGLPGKPIKPPQVVSKPSKKAASPQKPAQPAQQGYREYSEDELTKQAEDQARAAEWAGIAQRISDASSPAGKKAAAAAAAPPEPKIPGVNAPTIGRGSTVAPVEPIASPNDQPRDENGRFAPK